MALGVGIQGLMRSSKYASTNSNYDIIDKKFKTDQFFKSKLQDFLHR